MLLKCPECDLPVSDKAAVCPHCGFPLNENAIKKTRGPTKRKHRRLPNGFGQITEIKNRNLRKPFRAMVTVGKNEKGRPICKPLKPVAYFATYNEAYQALVEYHKNPYDFSDSTTMRELYERWFPTYEGKVKTASNMRTAWKYCHSIYDMRVADVRIRHIKHCIEEGFYVNKEEKIKASANMKNLIKILMNLMFDYAVEYEITDKNYARAFSLSDEVIKEMQTVKKGHIDFTKEEMEILWKNLYVIPYVDVLLIQCYSGWRPGEIVELLVDDVDITEWSFTGGLKTEAGVRRKVPIHSKIRDLVLFHYNEAKELGSDRLFNWVRTRNNAKHIKLTTCQYQRLFNKIIQSLNLDPNHRPHDGRVHFITEAKNAKVDEYAIKYMVGHKINDITEKVYTKREFSWLAEEIEKIK